MVLGSGVVMAAEMTGVAFSKSGTGGATFTCAEAAPPLPWLSARWLPGRRGNSRRARACRRGCRAVRYRHGRLGWGHRDGRHGDTDDGSFDALFLLCTHDVPRFASCSSL